MKTVPLHGKKAAGRVALIDDEDYALVSQYRWNVSQASRPGRDAGPYAAATRILGSRRVSVRMHQLITGYPQTDHRLTMCCAVSVTSLPRKSLPAHMTQLLWP